MPKSDSRAKGVMLQMLRLATSFLLVSVLCFGLVGCEEEQPPMQRGGGPDPAGSPPSASKANEPNAGGKAADNAAQTAEAQKPGAAESGADSAAGDQPATPVKKVGTLPPRVPSASEILGMERDDNAKPAADRLPSFLNSTKESDPKLLFEGTEPTPSDEYAVMGQEGMLEVSPLQRHWGGALRVSDVGAKKRLLTNSMAAPKDEENTTLFGPGAALESKTDEKEASGTQKASPSDEKQFELTMYRLNKKTLKVESVTRTYATAAARDAARSFLMKDGYSNKPPSPRALQELRDAQKKAEAQKKAAAQAKNACPFRATWTDNGITNSRCFNTAEALSKFQTGLQKKRQAKQKSQGAASKVKANNSTLRQNSIEPVKIK